MVGVVPDSKQSKAAGKTSDGREAKTRSSGDSPVFVDSARVTLTSVAGLGMTLDELRLSENGRKNGRGGVWAPAGMLIPRPLLSWKIATVGVANGVGVSSGPLYRDRGTFNEKLLAGIGRVKSRGVGAEQIAVPLRPAIASARSQITARRLEWPSVMAFGGGCMAWAFLWFARGPVRAVWKP